MRPRRQKTRISETDLKPSLFTSRSPASRARRVLPLLLACVACCAAPVAAQPVPPDEPWRTLDTEHFRVTFPRASRGACPPGGRAGGVGLRAAVRTFRPWAGGTDRHRPHRSHRRLQRVRDPVPFKPHRPVRTSACRQFPARLLRRLAATSDRARTYPRFSPGPARPVQPSVAARQDSRAGFRFSCPDIATVGHRGHRDVV